MNETMETTKAGEQSLAQTAMALLRHYLGQRRNLIILAVAVLGAGAYFNWGWLVAAGAAPLLLALAPCAVMCALGLCMMPGKKGATESTPGGSSAADQLRVRLGYEVSATDSTPGDPNGAVKSSEPVSSVKTDLRT